VIRLIRFSIIKSLYTGRPERFVYVTSSLPNVGTSSHDVVLDSDSSAPTTLDSTILKQLRNFLAPPPTARAISEILRHNQTAWFPRLLQRSNEKGQQNECRRLSLFRLSYLLVDPAMGLTRGRRRRHRHEGRQRVAQTLKHTTKLPVRRHAPDTTAKSPPKKPTIRPLECHPLARNCNATKIRCRRHPLLQTLTPYNMPGGTSPSGGNADKPTRYRH
jgi:hypothetical protein